MILLLGGTGYIGQAFQRELTRRGKAFTQVSRSTLDYTSLDVLIPWLKEHRPEFVVNCAGYTGKPNVDACELHKSATLAGNVLLPQSLALACAEAGIPWGHVSSGCIYSGAKLRLPGGGFRVEKDLTRPDLKTLMDRNPERFAGFTEEDVPNFSFHHPPCSFYSGTKALGETAMQGIGRSYIWRLRIPFDEIDNGRNYLSKVQNYAKVYDNVNSISHRADFASACLQLWDLRAPFGTYNVTNPGFVTTRGVVESIRMHLRPSRAFEFWANDEEFYRVAAKTPRSNCILDPSKLLGVGVKMRPVDEALETSLRSWRPDPAKVG